MAYDSICGSVLFPFRFARIPGIADSVLVVSETGEHAFITEQTLIELAHGEGVSNDADQLALRSRHFVAQEDYETALRLVAAKYRTKKSFLRHGPSLHILVVTRRCDHSCAYCQVSRVSDRAAGFDMEIETALRAVDRAFEFSAPSLTIEFQGGEPLLAFPVIQAAVSYAEEKARAEKRSVSFSIATTLHQATDEILDFLGEHKIRVSTSMDGPADLHDGGRLLPSGDAWQKSADAIQRARARLGAEAISATTTITRPALDEIERVIDALIDLGFHSVFLRPLSPYGFALRSKRRFGYSMEEFNAAYDRAIRYMLDLNAKGIPVREVYFSLAASTILTPFAHGYVDLRSPAGAGLGVMVYDYDGGVYPADEARMLAAQGDATLKLGTVWQSPAEWMASDAMKLVLAGSIAESIPGCSDCAFLPFCGADPVFHYATQGDPVGYRPTSDFCSRQTGMFQLLFRLLAEQDGTSIRTLLAWAHIGH